MFFEDLVADAAAVVNGLFAWLDLPAVSELDLSAQNTTNSVRFEGVQRVAHRIARITDSATRKYPKAKQRLVDAYELLNRRRAARGSARRADARTPRGAVRARQSLVTCHARRSGLRRLAQVAASLTMRVAIYTELYPPHVGGMEVRMSELAKALVARTRRRRVLHRSRQGCACGLRRPRRACAAVSDGAALPTVAHPQNAAQRLGDRALRRAGRVAQRSRVITTCTYSINGPSHTSRRYPRAFARAPSRIGAKFAAVRCTGRSSDSSRGARRATSA